MNVAVMSRAGAVRYCHLEHENKAVIISISDPSMYYSNAPFMSEQNRVVHILRLSFADADRPMTKDVYGKMATQDDLMTDNDAAQVAKLIGRYADTDIIVHCDAGISRSSGVAAAILKYVTGSDAAIFGNNRFCPNMWCYRKVLETLMEKDPLSLSKANT